MLINQIAVFLENKQGRLNDVVKVIAEGGINIQCLNIADTDEFGIVRMVTDDNKKASLFLKDAGFTSSLVDLVGIEVSNTVGTLSEVLNLLDENGIAIEYIYSFAVSEAKTLILFKTAQMQEAQTVLDKHNI